MKILIIGNIGATNLGDDAIFRGIVDFLNESNPTAQITCLSASPKHTQKEFNVTAAHFLPMGIRSSLKAWKTLRKTKKLYKEANIVLHGGGGLYTDETTTFAVSLWSRHLQKALHLKRPVYCIGQSLGPFESKSTEKYTKELFTKVKKCILRDKKSVSLLKEWGITGSYAPDCAFLSLIPTAIPISERKKQIIISLRPWQNKSKFLLPMLSQALKPYIDQGYELAFLPMQRIKEGDYALGEQLAQAVPLTILQPQTDLEAQEYINEAAFVIGMRLHTCIMATRGATPFISLSYSTKNIGFFETLNLPTELNLEIPKITVDGLHTSLSYVIDHQAEIHNKLAEKAQELHNEAIHVYKALLTESPAPSS